MMVVVKTDTDIFMNVVRFEAVEGGLSISGIYERPGLYFYLADSDFHYQLCSCNMERAKKLLDDITDSITEKLTDSNVVVFKFHDHVLSCL